MFWAQLIPCQLSGTTQGFDAHLANSGHTFDFSSCLGETNMTKSVYIYIYMYVCMYVCMYIYIYSILSTRIDNRDRRMYRARIESSTGPFKPGFWGPGQPGVWGFRL